MCVTDKEQIKINMGGKDLYTLQVMGRNLEVGIIEGMLACLLIG